MRDIGRQAWLFHISILQCLKKPDRYDDNFTSPVHNIY